MKIALLCLFGYGYVAGFVRARLRSVPIMATTRSAGKADAMRNDGIDALVIDFLSASETLPAPQSGSAWLVSVPPDDDGCPVHSALRQQASLARPAWIGYLSSTGVYGDLRGKWAFEETPPKPLSTRGTRRALAEQQWRAMGAHIFRLPGIYGPGRSVLDKVKRPDARRIIKPNQVFSRAHAADIADAIVASMRRPNPGRVYNIADDLPAPSDAVMSYAAELLGLPPPSALAYDSLDQPSAQKSFYAENKRISNARAKAELGWRPRYPDYRAGLDAIHAACELS